MHRGRHTLRLWLDTVGKQAILRFRSVPGICANMMGKRKGDLSPHPPISSLRGTLAGWLAGWLAGLSHLSRPPARPPSNNFDPTTTKIKYAPRPCVI